MRKTTTEAGGLHKYGCSIARGGGQGHGEVCQQAGVEGDNSRGDAAVHELTSLGAMREQRRSNKWRWGTAKGISHYLC